MKINKKLIFGLAILALFGTVTNYVYLSPLLTILLPFCLFAFNKEYLQRPVIWLYAFFFIFVLSAFMYDPTSLVSFGFYRRDGNFIISYSPLLVLPLFTFRQDVKKYMRYFFLFALCLYTILFIAHLFVISISLSLPKLVFGGLFVAQNAAGGFLAILAALAFAYAWNRQSSREWLYFGIVFIVMVATYSRGSILGFVLGLGAWYMAINKHFKTLILYLMIPVLLTVGALMIGYPYYKQKIRHSHYADVYVGGDEGISSKNANILIRVLYTFPRAYYSFTKSPIFGTGVGSYDDRPYKFREIVPYVQYNAQPKIQHTDGHAHHSYLMFLAEQGILGLGVFLIFWVSLFWYIMRMKDRPLLRDFLLIAFFTITIESFTEHRITTPSNMLPFTIPLGLIMAQSDRIKTYIIKKIPAA